MTFSTLLGLLLPPVAYDTQQPKINAEIQAEGNTLDSASILANAVLGGVTPFYANNLLVDWERVLDITAEPEASYQQRLQVVLIKLSESGGLSIPYFMRIAASAGYQINIDELEPFRAGVNRAGDVISVPDVIWVWRVNVFGSKTQTFRFRAGISAAGERLSSFSDTVLETVFNNLKPAHTFCYFTYQES
ncbi:TPA: YmfQ family protein [Yersinia enterocolitica]